MSDISMAKNTILTGIKNISIKTISCPFPTHKKGFFP